MTEGDAKTKICPLTLRGTPDTAGVIVANCVGSDCMAWRWQPSASMDNPTRVPGAGVQTIKHEQGYCGLAGHA